MRNKKLFALIPILVAPIFLSSCDYDEEVVIKDQQVPYRLITKEEGKTTIVDKDGVPQVFRSCEFRSDLFLLADGATPSDLKDYFALAKRDNFNSIDLPFMWSEMEKEQDEYVFDDIKVYLDFAKEFNLKLNIVWYGSFVDGQTHTANMPEYISANPNVYPQLQFCYESSVFGDCVIMDWNNANLKNRESAAVKELFNYIAEWNKENDYYNPVVMLQCGQGLDRLYRFRVNQYDVKVGGEKMTSDQAIGYAKIYANTISKAAKLSNYAPLTRVEFCEQTSVTNYVKEIYNGASKLDIVCSTYLHTTLNCRQGVRNFYDAYADSMPIMVTENWGNDLNARNALAAYATGAINYSTFNLSSPLYYPMESSPLPNQTSNLSAGAVYKRKKNGSTLDEKFEEINSRGSDIFEVNNLIEKISIPLAQSTRLNTILFGFDAKSMRELGNKQKIYLENGIVLDYIPHSTSDYAMGCANGDYLYFLSRGSGSIRLSNCFSQVTTFGKFDDHGFWQKDGNEYLTDNVVLNYQANTLYRIRVAGLQPLSDKQIDELSNQGYLDSYNSIKG